MIRHFSMESDLILDEDKYLVKNNWDELWKLYGAEKRSWIQAIKSTHIIALNTQRGWRREFVGVLVSASELCTIICYKFEVLYKNIGVASATETFVLCAFHVVPLRVMLKTKTV